MYLTGAKSSPWILLYLPSENKFLQTRQAVTWQNIHSCFVLASLQTVVDSVFIVAYLIGGGVLCLVLVLLFTTLFLSSFVIIIIGKRELVALL